MNKRKHPSVDKGDKSFKSGDESQNNVKCGHINNAVDLQRIQESLTRTGFLIDCEECKNLPAENVVGDKKLVLSLWLCLKCGNQACGRRRNKHALKHFSTPRSDSHALCVNTTVWSVWCYDCHDKVNLTCSRELQEAVECLQKQAGSTKIKQQIVNQALNITSDLQLSVSSSSAGDESQNTAKCGHINKAVDLERIKESLTRSGFLTDCEECTKLPTGNVVGEKKLVSSLWMCLKCGNQACGRRRNKHALNHSSSHRSDFHAMCVSTRVWQVWCYDCNKKVDWTCRIKLQEAVEFLKKQAESDKIKQQPNMQQIANQASNISPDSQLSISTSSTGDENQNTAKCDHINKAVDLQRIKESLTLTGFPTFCEECKKLPAENVIGEEKYVPSLWLCLKCGNQGCGWTRNRHALEHYSTIHSESHAVCVYTRIWRVWCFDCDDEVDLTCRRKLQEAVEFIKKLAELDEIKQQRSMQQIANQASNITSNLQLSGSSSSSSSTGAMPKATNSFCSSLPRARGLINLGNTGFFNSVLQCLGQTPYFLQLLEESSRRYFQLPGGKMVQENGEVVELSPLNGILKEWQPLTATLAETLRELQSGRAGDYNPWMLLSILISKRPQFGVEDQHDCYELLQQLLEVVREEDVTRYIASIMETFGFNYKKDPSTVEGEQKNIIKFYNQKVFEMFSPVEQVFRGVLVGNIVCQVCVHSSDHDHFFFDLSLPIPETQLLPLLKMKAEEIGVERKENKKQENHMTGNRLSIKQSLATDKDNKSNGVKKKGDEYDASMRLGTIPARNQWDKGECSVESCLNRFTRCELVLDPSKHVLIDNLPAVLILHLHRFLDKRYQLTKVTKFVKFPTLLDLAPFCSKRLQNLTSSKAGQTKVLYSLYGVVEHIAMRQGGHYVAYIKVRPPLQQNSYQWQFLRKNQKEEVCSSPKGVQGEPDLPPGKWYYTSDSTVIEVQESKVLEAQAYLLFYERIL